MWNAPPALNSIVPMESDKRSSIRHDRSKTKRGILKRDFELCPCSPSPKKKVNFNGAVKAYRIVHIDDYSERQKRNTWYNEDEYTRIKKQMFASFKIQNQSNLKEDNRFHCLRGLEDLSPTSHERRQQLRQGARDAVLNAQILQTILQVQDDDRLAKAYATWSSEAQRVAHGRGLADAHAVIVKMNTSLPPPTTDDSSQMIVMPSAA
jgi:hypothetical protein